MCNKAWRWGLRGLLCLLCGSSWAGLMAESTRVVFAGGSAEQSLQLINLNRYPVLVQAWVDDGRLDSGPDTLGAEAAVMPMPPIFRLNPDGQISLRLIATGTPLPVDRESLFWLNLYEIPPARMDLPAAARTLTVTLRTQMKVLMRPAGLRAALEDLPRWLRFAVTREPSGAQLRIDNPSPYFASFRALELRCAGLPALALAADMAPPLAALSLPLPASFHCEDGAATARFLLLDDDGQPLAGETRVGGR
ncbi:molecular chaperone [Chromobacterium sp. LK1]|uniref:fimbrial biogenesis chaperone n=1 Tax=Chromobacterium sp. LK1 TaxID=1628193 RepID=UPI00069EA9AB|nr:molecular chaperone [Chromobacterium sp. LK1]